MACYYQPLTENTFKRQSHIIQDAGLLAGHSSTLPKHNCFVLNG